MPDFAHRCAKRNKKYTYLPEVKVPVLWCRCRCRWRFVVPGAGAGAGQSQPANKVPGAGAGLWCRVPVPVCDAGCPGTCTNIDLKCQNCKFIFCWKVFI